MQKNLV